MTALLDFALRVSLLLAAGLVAAWLLHRRSAALRHAVLSLTLLAVPIVPVAGYLLPPVVMPPVMRAAADPELPVVRTPTLLRSTETVAVSAGPVASPGREWGAWLFVVWGAGAVASLLQLAWSLVRLTSATRRAVPVTSERWQSRLAEIVTDVGLTRPVRLLVVPEDRVLAVWGWPRSNLLLPGCALTWPDARVATVLRHELAHVRRGDWVVHLHAAIVRAALWWHPLAWLACRRLAAESERACDDAVLAQGVEPSAYAEHLVAIARALAPARLASVTVPMASPSTLHQRIMAMLNPAVDRTAPARTTLALLLVLAGVLVLPVSLLRGQPAAQTLQGVVYDPTGAVMPGVTLALHTGDAKAESTTDAAGQFAFAGVAGGQHVLEARVPGFRVFRQPLDLRQDGDWERTVTLQVGNVQESIRVTGKRGNTAGTAAVGPTPVRVGGNIRPPRKLKDVKPVYPQAMRDAGREGRVTLDAVIGADGRVIAAHVTSPEVHPDFAVAAVDAVKQWLFSPTLLNGAPIDVVMTVTIEFTLE